MSRSRRGEAARRLGLRAERLTLWLLWARGWDLVAWRQKLGRWELDLLVNRGPELRLRLHRALRTWLDRVPWPGVVSFQRVSWAGWRCRFHPPEGCEGLRIPR